MRSLGILDCKYVRDVERTVESFLPVAVLCLRDLHVQSYPQRVQAMTDK